MAKLLVLKAGSAASNNLIRALRAGDPSLHIVGCHDDRFILNKSAADLNYALPASENRLLTALRNIVNAEKIDLVIPNSESTVTAISRLRDRLPCRTFLPRRSVIQRCQDKYQLGEFLRRHGLPVPRSYLIDALSEVPRLFRRFKGARQLWCRIRKGSGSVGAIPVATSAQARSWIKYWEEMRAIRPGSFTLSEYLPGRDLTVQCLFRDGLFLMAKMHERLSYHVVAGAPSGVSSTAALAKMVLEPTALDTSVSAIRLLDKKASGVFFVDLKENAAGTPCITEINAGRFANVPTIHDCTTPDNMSLAFVRAALGEDVGVREPQAYPESSYVLRSLDTLPAVVAGDQLFGGVRESIG